MYCFVGISPTVSYQYVLTCLEGQEQKELLINISKLEGRFDVLQRMVPIYASLLVAIVLFLTWTQAGIAKSTAIDEINDNFKSYKDRIEILLDQANDLTEKIKIKHEGICELTDEKFKLSDLMSTLKNKKDGKTG